MPVTHTLRNHISRIFDELRLEDIATPVFIETDALKGYLTEVHPDHLVAAVQGLTALIPIDKIGYIKFGKV